MVREMQANREGKGVSRLSCITGVTHSDEQTLSDPL